MVIVVSQGIKTALYYERRYAKHIICDYSTVNMIRNINNGDLNNYEMWLPIFLNRWNFIIV